MVPPPEEREYTRGRGELRAEGREAPPPPPPRRSSRWSSILWVLGIFFVLAGTAVGGWIFLGDSLLLDPDAEIPLVRAEPGPVKVRPESPGGMEVPDRDKLIYGRMEGEEGTEEVEQLLPPPPEPKPLPQPETPEEIAPAPSEVASAQVTAPQPAEPSNKPLSLMPEPEQKPQPVVPKPEAVASKPAASPAPVPKSEPQPEPKPEPKPQPKAEPAPNPVAAPKPAPKPAAKPTAPAVTGEPAYRVQLAAVRSESAAKSEWNRLRRKHPDLLGGLTLHVMRADLGKKGIYYRVRGGPLADEAAARNLCAKLSGQGVGCLVVRPGG